MAVPSLDLPFVSSQALPFDLYEPLLSWVFQRPEFRQWLLPGSAWQLRLVGGPGSGKTALSALTVKHLESEFPNPYVRVVSIFFRDVSSLDVSALAYCLIEEISRQVSAPTDAKTSESAVSRALPMPESSAPLKLEDLRKEVVTKLSQLERAFLVLDDVDLCSQDQWIAVEAELTRLQSHGMNIMMTSRLSLWHEHSVANCDTGWPPEHGYMNSCLFWYCACQDSIQEALIVCQKCKDDGYKCGECDQSTSFVEPYDHVDLSIDIDGTIISTYVSHMLEVVHGDLGLSSSAHPKPAHSKLGRALIASEAAAIQLRDKIVADAEVNITMAKLRLEEIDGAATIEEVVRYGDRLPATIVSVFDAVIAGIQTRDPYIEDIGLKAIVGVANQFHERSFDGLLRWLQRQMKQEGHEHSLPKDLTLEDILRATAGLLVVENHSECTFRLYHGALEYYVTERYNETLFWIHTSTNTVDVEEFEKPKRMKTWHASQHHLTRADTWK